MILILSFSLQCQKMPNKSLDVLAWETKQNKTKQNFCIYSELWPFHLLLLFVLIRFFLRVYSPRCLSRLSSSVRDLSRLFVTAFPRCQCQCSEPWPHAQPFHAGCVAFVFSSVCLSYIFLVVFVTFSMDVFLFLSPFYGRVSVCLRIVFWFTLVCVCVSYLRIRRCA